MIEPRVEKELPPGADDAALVLAARQDPTAFVALYDRYAQRVERYVLGRVHHRQDAEDLVSAIFLQALARIDTYDPRRGGFAPWLFSIARNRVTMHFRDRPRERPDAALPDRTDPAATPDRLAVRNERSRQIRAAVASLPAAQRDALALRYLADLPFADVARVLGKSEGAAKMNVRRGLEALRRRLPERELER